MANARMTRNGDDPVMICATMLSAAPPFSWLLFLTMFVIFASSLLMFLLLVRRWTTKREWVTLAEWARQRGFKFRGNDLSRLPVALGPLKSHAGQIRLHLCRENITVLEIETKTSSAPAETAKADRWNLLVRRRVNRTINAAALRPAQAAKSVVDLFGLSQFPNLSSGQRFTVWSTTSSSARALADSASRTLLPNDLGLLLIDDWIILDFSARPFDPIELDRMTSVAEQLSQML